MRKNTQNCITNIYRVHSFTYYMQLNLHHMLFLKILAYFSVINFCVTLSFGAN